MKILFLSHYGAMLGANRSLLSLVQGLRAKGVETMIYCPKEAAFSEELRKLEIPFEIVAYQNWADTFLLPGFWLLPLRYFQNRRLMPALLKKVQQFNPDIIHTNSSVLGIGAQLAEQLKIPHVWHIRELTRLHYNMRFFPGESTFYSYLAKAAKLIVISKAVKKEIIGNRQLPHELIFNGVVPKTHFNQDISNFAKAENEETTTFLLIGMLHPNKNQLMAVQAFEQIAKAYPKARLLIVGTGRRLYEKRLKDFCKNKDIENQVHFAGYLPNPKDAYLQSDVVLMCSENEAMGRVTVEAMAYGKPVIGYKSGATPELIEHGKDGFLFENGSTELAKYLKHFLEKPNAINIMGQNGFASAKEKFTIDQYVNKMYRTFAALLSK